MSDVQLDEFDRKILAVLQEDARISNLELAERVGLSPAPVSRRVMALEKAGVIRKYVAVIDPSAVDLTMKVFVEVSLVDRGEKRFEMFEHAVRKMPEVGGCHRVTGDPDYFLRVVVPDLEAFESFLKRLTTHPEVGRIKSHVTLKEVKYTLGLPVKQKTERHSGGGAFKNLVTS